MVDTPIDPPRRAVRLHPGVSPLLQHAGWFCVFLLVAPTIGPRGYGLFLIALSSIAICEALLTEVGGAALVGLREVDDRHWSTALVTLIAVGGAVWLLLYPIAGLVAVVFAEPSLHDLIRSLAILPLLGALCVVPRAALHREQREAPVAAASAAGFAAGGALAVALVWAGAGPWSLVAQIIMQRLVECVVLWGMPGEGVGLTWSRRHFDELAGAIRPQALAEVWPTASFHASCFVVGLMLGPTAAGLYMLAMRLAAALANVFLAGMASAAPREIGERAFRAVLPAVLTSALLPIALPPLIDVRWWGAIWPAQILLLGAVPGAVGYLYAASAPGEGEPRWRALQGFGSVAILAFVAAQGLGGAAMAQLGCMTLVACIGLWSARRWLWANRRALLGPAARRCGGAIVAGVLLFGLANPVGLSLPPVPALCLLTASGWLVYLVIRGEPSTPTRPLFALQV